MTLIWPPGFFLFIVTLPGLIDQVSVNCINVRLAQDVRETFHSGWCERPAKNDFLENVVNLRWQFAQVWCHAGAEYMAA